ncbi:MAG TPA: DUF3108 domain-containing protein [Burkholderiaceae bacterium]|nr:DUF3108 domain-containing protein [Burkholderiaceae bacterium]
MTARIVGAPLSRRRTLRFIGIVAAVGAFHAALLQQTLASWPDPAPTASPPRAVQVGAPPLAMPSVVSAAETPNEPVLPAAPKPAAKPVPPRRFATPAEPASPPAEAPVPVAVAAAAPVEVPVAATAAASAPTAAGIQPPVYATRMPPSVHWAYVLRRGFLSGRGDLRWSLREGRYEARLEGNVAGFNVLDWMSRGAIDAAGAAPERFVIRRRGKEAMAANFQRQAGKITYSGPTTEHPLPMGAQDRLSLLLQLTAIVAANPQRFHHSDARIVVFVTGARGDADVWTFDIVGEEGVDTPRGPARALHLRREPRNPYDTLLDVWLDPARHHLPVRAQLANAGGGEPLELLLSDEDPSS